MTNFKRFSIAAALSGQSRPQQSHNKLSRSLVYWHFTRAWGSGQLQVGQRTRSHQLAASLYR